MPEPQTEGGPKLLHSLAPERRTYVRVASNLDATCREGQGGREVGWPGKVRDISRAGIGLLATHRFWPGTHLTVDLRDRTDAVVHTVQVHVIHSTAVNIDGTAYWHLGCAFHTLLSEEELQALL
ncbi:MAG TPA: PilZ domain-containing protein [Gemmataceae bacterium]|nr:PilZ domain-containing protein [Gemmataceae bacterium]